jgi:primosomal replication protein N
LNRLVLSARLVQRSALRYTPAGVPALDLELTHESQMSEDGQTRKVALQMRAVAIGTITAALQALTLGAAADFAGFVAAARNGRGLLFHVTDIAPAAP